MRIVERRTRPHESSLGAGHPVTGRDSKGLKVRSDIERLEKTRDESADTGIRKLIEARIEEQKQKLASGTIP
jgi:hypothetical protein